MLDASKVIIHGDVKAQAIVAASPQVAGKWLATLTAEFALRGHTLQALSRQGRTLYVVSCWGQSRTFSHPNDIEAFLRQVGGRLVTNDVVAAFATAIDSTDMHPPADIIADGNIHRFSASGEGAPCDGWYVLRYEACLTGVFGKRHDSAFAWSPTAGVKRVSGDEFEDALSSLRAQMNAFSSGIVFARDDSRFTVRYASRLLRIAERMLELGVQPGLYDPTTLSGSMAEPTTGAGPAAPQSSAALREVAQQ